MKKIFFIFYCSFLLLSCNTSKENVHFYVNKLIEGKRHESQTIGIGFPSSQWPNYLKFKGLSSEKSLINYCNHSNSVIRAYAFEALLDINKFEAKKIYHQQKNKSLKVEVMHGCTYSGTVKLADLYGQLVYNKWGTNLPCYGGAQTEEDKTYFWFLQKP